MANINTNFVIEYIDDGDFIACGYDQSFVEFNTTKDFNINVNIKRMNLKNYYKIPKNISNNLTRNIFLNTLTL